MSKVNEKWKDIKGYKGFYQVSNLGNIRSVERYIIQKNGIKRKCKSTYLIGTDNNFGYLQVTLCNAKSRKWKYIHRIVASTFKTNKLKLPCVNHKNGNKKDNRVRNLEWCTYKENNRHAIKMGLSPVKGDKPNARKVINCRGQIFETTIEAAKVFNLFRDGNISAACSGKRNYAGKYPDGTRIKWKYYENPVDILEDEVIYSVNEPAEV